MRAIVTGGAGFIGSHVVDALVAQGAEVAVVDSLVHGKEENVAAGAELHVRDIREPLDDIFDAVRPEAVFHLAAQADVRVSVERPVEDAEVERPRDRSDPRSGATARRAGRVRLDRWRDLRRVRRAGARGLRVRAALPVRHREARGRGVPALVQPPLRDAPHRPALRERVRAASGPARRGRASSRSSSDRSPAASRRGSSATAGRRATTSTSATWHARPCRRSATRAACSTSAPAARRP